MQNIRHKLWPEGCSSPHPTASLSANLPISYHSFSVHHSDRVNKLPFYNGRAHLLYLRIITANRKLKEIKSQFVWKEDLGL